MSARQAIKRNQSVEKVIGIIETMAHARGPMRLQDIASALGQPPSTTLRFLGTLMDADYVIQDPETLRYSLTLKLCHLSDLIRSQINIRDVVRPHLVELAESCRESSCMAIEEDRMVVYVDVVDGPDSMLRTLQRIGKRAPMHSTGVGKTLLLNYPPDELESIMSRRGMESLTRHTITSLPRLLQELAGVRRQGFAVDDEECEAGVRCVAAPLRDYTGRIVASISISGPATRMTDDKMSRTAERLRAAAHQISRRLGWEERVAGEPVTADRSV